MAKKYSVCRPGPLGRAGIILQLLTAQAKRTTGMQKKVFFDRKAQFHYSKKTGISDR
jgi:hypothetical protein